MQKTPLYLAVALSLTLWPATGSAQEVEFDLPTEINIVQGRLSVVFQDHVHEETARLLVTGLGYDIIDAAFEPRYAWTTLRNRLGAEQRQRLENDDRIVSLSESPLPEPVLTINDESIERTRPRFSLAVVFESHVSREDAETLLKEAAGATITKTEKRPNELVIDVGDQDAEAFSMLEGREEVKWVTYVGVAG